jgi:nucleotide-binding universal stress UspA family protein
MLGGPDRVSPGGPDDEPARWFSRWDPSARRPGPQERQHGAVGHQDVGLEVRDTSGRRLDQGVEQKRADPAVRQVGERVQRLVACLDGSELAERALPFAADLAQRLAAEFFLVSVVPEGRLAPGDIPEVTYLRDRAERLPCPPPLFDVVQDRLPARAITRYVGDRGDSLFVVATHGRGGLRSAVMGSVARGITHQAACPTSSCRRVLRSASLRGAAAPSPH